MDKLRKGLNICWNIFPRVLEESLTTTDCSKGCEPCLPIVIFCHKVSESWWNHHNYLARRARLLTPAYCPHLNHLGPVVEGSEVEPFPFSIPSGGSNLFLFSMVFKTALRILNWVKKSIKCRLELIMLWETYHPLKILFLQEASLLWTSLKTRSGHNAGRLGLCPGGLWIPNFPNTLGLVEECRRV